MTEKNKNQQTLKIWDKLMEQENKILEEYQKTHKAIILDVKEMTNNEFFGGNDIEKFGMRIGCQVKDIGDTFDLWYSVPSFRGYKKSNAFAFKQKYGKYPQPSLEVDVKLNDSGFWEIVLE